MFATPEIFLQADIEYHRDRIKSQFVHPGQRRGTPVRRRRKKRHDRRTQAAAAQLN
jgi:hypothetical protein